ncbi:hypothetical protein CTRI78_v001725 [Colletotrichum trifolii]|uniref:Uncharacterized protein n=1 Tax=Colletotrichum trifolii TaxID=5466 RepID=A0A4R8RT73_COLTR|nr:hypothetical protein CTRI78_v001725 [Colletotrichum trifolii]
MLSTDRPDDQPQPCDSEPANVRLEIRQSQPEAKEKAKREELQENRGAVRGHRHGKSVEAEGKAKQKSHDKKPLRRDESPNVKARATSSMDAHRSPRSEPRSETHHGNMRLQKPQVDGARASRSSKPEPFESSLRVVELMKEPTAVGPDLGKPDQQQRGRQKGIQQDSRSKTQHYSNFHATERSNAEELGDSPPPSPLRPIHQGGGRYAPEQLEIKRPKKT